MLRARSAVPSLGLFVGGCATVSVGRRVGNSNVSLMLNRARNEPKASHGESRQPGR